VLRGYTKFGCRALNDANNGGGSISPKRGGGSAHRKGGKERPSKQIGKGDYDVGSENDDACEKIEKTR